MCILKKPLYRRILLKLSGELFRKKKNSGMDFKFIDVIVQDIKKLISLGVCVAVVVGGGNLFRGIDLVNLGIRRVISDQIGMLSTVINGLALNECLQKNNLASYVYSAINLPGICKNYQWDMAIKKFNNNSVIIYCFGLGSPFFTTDSTACIRSIEMNADILLKGTKVNGVYSSDPHENSSAYLYKNLRYMELLEKKLNVMDYTSLVLARDHKLPIRVFNIYKPNILYNIVIGKNLEGTLIS